MVLTNRALTMGSPKRAVPQGIASAMCSRGRGREARGNCCGAFTMGAFSREARETVAAPSPWVLSLVRLSGKYEGGRRTRMKQWCACCGLLAAGR